MSKKQYLDYDGLKKYHESIKKEISEKNTELERKIQSISIDTDNETLIIQ